MNSSGDSCSSESECAALRAWRETANADLLSITNPYWLRFHPPTCAGHAAIAIGYAALMIPGVLGNLLMIFTFLTTSLRNHRNLMSANLALADLIMNLEAPFVIKNSLECGPKYFSVAGCQMYGFMGGLSGTAAIASITAMAYQRYLKITKPFTEGSFSDATSSSIFVIGCWLYALTFSLFPIVSGLTHYTPEGYLTACSFDYLDHTTINRVWILSFGFSAYCVPMTLITYFYMRIIREVRNTNQNMIALHRQIPVTKMQPCHITPKSSSSSRNNIDTSRPPSSSRSSSAHYAAVSSVDPSPRPESAASCLTTASRQEQMMFHSKMVMERKLVRSVALLIVTWIISWTPYALIAFAGVFSFNSLLHPLVSMLPALFCKLSSVANPYIYFYSHPRFRREALLIMARASKWSRSRFTHQETTMSRFTSVAGRPGNLSGHSQSSV